MLLVLPCMSCFILAFLCSLFETAWKSTRGEGGQGKKKEQEKIVGIIPQDGWMTFCPCFSWAELLQCWNLSACLSVLLIWSQNTQNCIWVAPPDLVQSQFKRLQNFIMPKMCLSAPKIPNAQLRSRRTTTALPQGDWLHLVPWKPRAEKLSMLTFSFKIKGIGKIKQPSGNDAFQEPRKTIFLPRLSSASQGFVIIVWAIRHLESSAWKAAWITIHGDWLGCNL